MIDTLTIHKPVMLNEMLNHLQPIAQGNYLDCTFGAGGYSRAILSSCDCNVMAIDRDPNVVDISDEVKNIYPDRFKFINTTFAESFTELSDKTFDGIVLDLGVSSMQLDEGDRGFSFSRLGPLDMRMSKCGYSAEDFINEAEEKDIADVIYKYGDEVLSRRIAKRIVENRVERRITTTEQLADIVHKAIGFRKGKIDSATKTFQAIRIYINDELGQLERFLANTYNILKQNGRLVIISFHSSEDRIVKNFFKDNSEKIIAKSKYAKSDNIILDPAKWLKILTPKALKPSEEEIRINPRSRSARLRAAEKI